MATEKLPSEDAVASISAVRHSIQPNDGFITQLRVWEEMGCQLDDSHAFVKQKALDALSERQLAGEQINKEEFAKPEENAAPQVGGVCIDISI